MHCKKELPGILNADNIKFKLIKLYDIENSAKDENFYADKSFHYKRFVIWMWVCLKRNGA